MATVRDTPPGEESSLPAEVTQVTQEAAEGEDSTPEGGTGTEEKAGHVEESEEQEITVSGEEEKALSAALNEDNPTPAPDVTYDVTVLESQTGQVVEETSRGEEEEAKEEEAEKEVKEEGEEEGEEKEVKEGGEEEGEEEEKEEGLAGGGEVREEGEGVAVQEKTEPSQDGGEAPATVTDMREEPSREAKEEGSGEGSQAAEEWMDILGSGELKKKVLRPGGGVETRPTPQCRVRLRTKGTLEKGALVDRHHSVPFTLGDGDVIQAWDLATSLMETGEVALVKTTARFAYGKNGRSPDVPPDASITYELELLEVQAPVDFSTIEEKELITLVDRKRIRGNELFQRKDFPLAINSYDRALKLLEGFIEQQAATAVSPAVTNMQVRCLNNLAAAQLKVEMYKESQESCQKVLEKDPNNVKALFRSGKVFAVQGELNKAVANLEKALKLNPDERAIQVELQRTLKKKERMEKEERDMYKRMVEGVAEKGSQGSGAKGEKGKQRKQKQERWGPIPYLAIAALVATVGIGIAYFLTQRPN